MRIPGQPKTRQLEHLSPSTYEAARVCKARAAWAAFGNRDCVPHHPQALLGTCVHAVVEEAHKGSLPAGDEESRRAAARALFDTKAKALHDHAHPLLRAKFPAADRIPYYYLFRERAAVLAVGAASRPPTAHAAPSPGKHVAQVPLVETTLKSHDGLLVGRPDYVDPGAAEVVDYKTGGGPDGDPDGLRDSEARQLRLYVHLAREHGLDVRKGTVVRVDGRRVTEKVSEADATDEGKKARDVLATFNANASAGFDALAEPSPEACRYCPCIPFCESFWAAASPAWAEQCGTHLEGTISAVNRAVVQNTALITLELAPARGTVGAAAAVLQQLPEAWACVDGSPAPATGDVVRVVDCRLADDAGDTAVIRPDRLTTALWTVRHFAPPAAQQGASAGTEDG